jgi:hypothetical protein
MTAFPIPPRNNRMNQFSTLKGSLAALLLLPAIAVAQSSRTIETAPYLPSAYTANFTRSIEFLATGKAESPTGEVKAAVSGSQKPGSRVKRFDRDFIGVEQTGLIMLGDEKFDSTHLYLFDPGSGLPAFMIDRGDESVTRYEWMSVPARMPIGEAVTVGKLTGMTKDGKLSSVGVVSFRAQDTKGGLEFCQIEVTLEADSGDKSVSEECFTFDTARVPTSTRASLEMDGKKVLEASGPIRLR